MKKVCLFLLMTVSAGTLVQAQKLLPASDDVYNLITASENPALARANEHLAIHDATLLQLKRKALGLPNTISPSGIVGIPKGTYGIMRGQLLLHTTTAPTLGTGTGSGSVGTGTHLGTVGASGNSLGVNGKSPDAGPALYGVRPYGSFIPKAKDWIRD